MFLSWARSLSSLSDQPSSFNNRSSELDFFAPGEGINTSTLPASSFADVDHSIGTSVAAAHVSSAWAVLKSKNPNASVGLVKRVLSESGEDLQQGPIIKPRINITSALDALASPTEAGDELCVPVIANNGATSLVCL